MMKTAHLAAPIALSALALSACAATGAATPLPDGSDVALGQRAYFDGPIVQPVEVLEDSRCPMNARCVWAGRVRVKMVWWRGNGEKQPFEVTLGESTPLADGAIRLGRSGTTIVVDNVVREGGVLEADSDDERIVGTRALFDMLSADPRLDATAVQTVGAKKWDGFVLARVR